MTDPAPPASPEPDALTFRAFRQANLTRCLKWHPAGIESWSPSDWLAAVTGELGELASLVKMRNRERDGLPGNKFSPSQKQVADEIADVLTYLDLFAAALGIDLGASAVEKFNEVSARVGFPDRINLAAPAPGANAAPPDVAWKSGNEFAPYHPQASHVSPDYRDGWNACYRQSEAALRALAGGLATARLKHQEEATQIVALMHERDDARAALAAARALLNTPETADFVEGVKREAAHQVQRWGYAHDRSKSAENWFWLVGYLAGKALRSAITGDHEKALHHCISSAAALFNWHTAIKHDTTGAGIGQDDDLRAQNPKDAQAADDAALGEGAAEKGKT